nr:MAG TPA: hypothetical protein [Caudoviricetes sp.]
MPSARLIAPNTAQKTFIITFLLSAHSKEWAFLMLLSAFRKA